MKNGTKSQDAFFSTIAMMKKKKKKRNVIGKNAHEDDRRVEY